MSSLDLTIGAVEVGVFISTVLFGVAASQAQSYVYRGFKDPLPVRLMVIAICLLEMFHTICIWAYLYKLTVTDYGQPTKIGDTPWSLVAPIISSSFTSIIIQCYLTNRVRLLSGSIILALIGWTGGIFHFVLALVMSGFALNSGGSVAAFVVRYGWILTTDLTVHAAVDIYNATALCFFLLRRRSKFERTQRVVQKLVIYTVETGLITSLFSIALLTCSIVMSDNYVFLGIFMIYPKLFSNVLLVSLTGRENMRRTLGLWDSTPTWGFTDQGENNFSSQKHSHKPKSVTAVQVTTEFQMTSA